jgi:acetoin utilization deacetylase AcuC-like enzyme
MSTVYVTHPRYTEHDLPGHPEHAGRIRAVWDQMRASGLLERIKTLEPQPVDEDLILAVHTAKYRDLLRWMESTGQRSVHLDPDTYAGPTSYEIARLSAGGVVMAVDEVLSGRADNALAAVRPPGHHAMPGHAMGFCILGNVPIAVRYAQKQYGVGKVMIVDYDVHHGNGTEAMFYDDDSVLFVSTHQYPFYPGTGAVTDTGTGKGEGYTINIPMAGGQGDRNYSAVFERIVWPAAERFKPELIIVSAGFDAHWTDPLASMRLTNTGYAHLSRELVKMARQFCRGKIVFALEGGYNLAALSHGVRNIGHVLVGDSEVSDPLGPPRDSRPQPNIDLLIEQIRSVHRLG